MSDCAQELCPNWGGDGRVCPCALFDLDQPIVLRDGRRDLVKLVYDDEDDDE